MEVDNSNYQLRIKVRGRRKILTHAQSRLLTMMAADEKSRLARQVTQVDLAGHTERFYEAVFPAHRYYTEELEEQTFQSLFRHDLIEPCPDEDWEPRKGVRVEYYRVSELGSGAVDKRSKGDAA